MPRPLHLSTGRREWRAGLRRSLFLLREFRYEQPDPARFYTALAEDSAAQVSQYADLSGDDAWRG